MFEPALYVGVKPILSVWVSAGGSSADLFWTS